MPRLHLRVRVRTLLVLVALAALAFGGVRWWHARKEILKLAAWHDTTAAREEAMAQFVREEIRRWEEIVQRLRSFAQMTEGERKEREDFRKKFGLPVAEADQAPVIPEEQVLNEESKAELANRTSNLEFHSDLARWHKDRARELRGKWLFNLLGERERDWERAEQDLKRSPLRGIARSTALFALYERCALAEEAYAEKLAHDDAPKSSFPGFDKASRVAHHRKRAAEYRKKASKAQTARDAEKKERSDWDRVMWFRDYVPFDLDAQADYRKLGLLEP